MRAGERALARYANSEAADHFGKAVALADKLPNEGDRDRALLAARLSLGQAQVAAGYPQEAMVTLRLAAESARGEPDTAGFVAAALGFDTARFLSNEPMGPSVELLRQALSRIETDDSSEGCRILSRLVRAYYMLGETHKAEDMAARSIEIARCRNDDRSLLEVMLTRFSVSRGGYLRAQIPEKRALLEELLAKANRLDDYEVKGRVLSTPSNAASAHKS
jgi:hypothetical protein